MQVFKRKTRQLAVRLSEDEYVSLYQASRESGARSVSDFAREMLFSMVRVRGFVAPVTDVEARLNRFASELEALNQDIQGLRNVIVSPSQRGK